MTVIIPSSHPASALYQQIVQLKLLIATPGNAAHMNQWKTQLPELQRHLVGTLLDRGELPASAILSTMTLHATDAN